MLAIASLPRPGPGAVLRLAKRGENASVVVDTPRGRRNMRAKVLATTGDTTLVRVAGQVVWVLTTDVHDDDEEF